MGHSNVAEGGRAPFWHHRWVQLAIGIVCMGLVANLQYAWTLFVVPMDNAHHWGQAAIQTAFTIFIVTETWLVPVEGWLVDKFGPRPVVIGGALCAALGWIINAHATSLTELYVAAVIAGIGAGCVYGTCVGMALKWFPDKRGLAAGLTAAGFGAGAAVTVIPIANMIQRSGYEHAFMFFGIFQGVCILLLATMLVRPKPPATAIPAKRVVASKIDYTSGEMIRSPLFWVLYLMFVFVAAGGIIATAQLGPIAKEYGFARLPVNLIGITLPLLTMTLSIDNLCNGLTRPLVRLPVGPHWPRKHDVHDLPRRRRRAAGTDAVRPQPVCIHVLRGRRLPLLGRDLLDLPRDLRGHVRQQIRRGKCRHALHREGHGLDAGADRIAAVGERRLEHGVHLRRR